MSELPDDLLKQIKDAAEDQAKAWAAFKETNDANAKEHDAVWDEKLAKIENELSGASETLNQKLTAFEESQKAAEEAEAKQTSEFKEKLTAIETAINRKPVGPEAKATEQHEFWEGWARASAKSIMFGQISEKEQAVLMEAKDLSVGDDTTGGYLAPSEYVMEILKGVVEISPFRGLARVRQTSRRSLEIPKRTQTAAAGWTAELATRAESTNPAFGMEEVPTHEMYAMIDVSEQNLEDSAFNLESFIREEAQEQFGVLEGAAFIDGNAVGKPEGILTNSGVGSTNSGSAATIADSAGQANGIIDLYHAIKTAYARNASWVLNRTTLGSVRKLKDGNNNYIWTPGLANLRPNTILDQPYTEMPDMPDEGAGTTPIAFGDWRRGYMIVDRVSMSMLRDPYTQAASGLIRLWFRRRVGGQVVISEAMRKLTCSV